MSLVNSGWVKLWRELLSKSIWTQSSPQCAKVLITILLLANHEENEWEYKGTKYKCGPGQLITSINSLRQSAGEGVTTEGVRSAISRLCRLGFITDEATKTGRLITVVNWEKYQQENNGTTMGTTMGTTKPTPKTPQSYPKDTPPNKNDKNNRMIEKEKEINKEKESEPEDDPDWIAEYLKANGEEGELEEYLKANGKEEGTE